MSSFSVRTASDGSRVIAAVGQLGAYPHTVCEDLVTWAARTPDATFLAERRADAWRRLTYGDALERVRSIGAGLLASGASPDAPVGIVADNGIDHALVAFAAMYVGIPVSPISTGYATAEASPARLRDLLGTLGAGVFYAGSDAIAARIATAREGARIVTDLAELDRDGAAADAAFSRVGPDTVAKIMFTSGSTGSPKGVITTNRMLCANQSMIAMVWPELAGSAPVAVDWLPWSHVFGGNHNVGIILRTGGTLYVDEGRPMPGAFEATLRNLREFPPTVFFGVPRGVALLVEALRADEAFARGFFSNLRLFCSAGASLPDPVRHELIALTETYGSGNVRITSSWGMTETAPFVTTSWGSPEPDIDTIGTPSPGLEIKFAPSDGRTEIRVRGPNVTPGYWRNPEATRAAFDADGFYKTGDAAHLKDETDPARGIVFAGRLAENFKLSSGTWVNVGALRLALLEQGAPLVEDLVITGHDRDEIGALIFVSRAHAAKLTGTPDAGHADIAQHPSVRESVAAALARHNAAAPASSTRVTRALILPEPPKREAGEITDKGTINQRRALDLRAASVQALYAGELGPDVLTPLTRVQAAAR